MMHIIHLDDDSINVTISNYAEHTSEYLTLSGILDTVETLSKEDAWEDCGFRK